MTVVDNNVLSALAKAEALDLSPATFDAVATTPGVVEELDTARIEGEARKTQFRRIAPSPARERSRSAGNRTSSRGTEFTAMLMHATM